MGDEAQDGMIGAIAEIQRRSLDAAAALVERLVSAVDGRVSEADTPADETPAPTGIPVPAELLDGWTKLWRDSISSLATTFGGAGSGPSSTALTVDGTESPTAAVVLDLAPGGSGSIEVWVHNPTDLPRDALRPHCGAPRTHDGAELAVSDVAFDPAAFDLPPRSSRGIRLTVHPNGAAAGSYRALVQVEGLSDQWLPIEIRVPGHPTP